MALSKITLMNQAVLKGRLKGLMNLLLDENHTRVIRVMNETIALFNTVVVNDLDKAFSSYAHRELCHALLELATHKYEQAFFRLAHIDRVNNIVFYV
jgi:hypothetical protein